MTPGTFMGRRCFARIVTAGHWRFEANTPWVLMGYTMMRLWRVGGFVCLLGCAHAAEAPATTKPSPATAHYTVTIYDNFRGAKVRACLEGATVRELVPIGESDGRELSGAWLEGESLDIARGHIRLKEPLRAACIDYATRFEPPMLRPSDSDAVILSQAQWLWRPDPFPADLDASIRFVVPAGSEASFPWPSSEGVYFPAESAFFSSAFGVFGQFERQAFSAAGTHIDVARLGHGPSDDDVRAWITSAMQTTASLGDRFPRDRVYIFIVPVRSPEKQVAFGMVRRGGGSSILLVASPDATAEELVASWVTVHELSHLWLPPLHAKDRWLSEGIATYLQEVLRARCGLQSAEHAWARLRKGFERGRRSGTGRKLSSESENMNRTGAYHRVYWAGAAFAMEVDARLRKGSGGEMTLLRAISDAQRVWGTEARPVPASMVLDALDDANGTEFVAGLAERYAQSTEFPDVPYVDSPAYRQVRAQITSRADGACRLSVESSR
jgi:hypothetical protein